MLRQWTALLLVSFMVCTGASAGPIADSAQQVTPILPGTALPSVSVRDRDGQAVDLTAVADGPAVIVFYRGGWCPFCNLQLADLRLIHPELKELGYRLIAISPDSTEKLNETLGNTDLDYTLISDSDALAMQAFGVAFRVETDVLNRYREAGLDLGAAAGSDHGLLPAPGVFIFDRQSILQFAYVHPDYRVRVPGPVILAAAREIAADRHKLQPRR
ncbi:MAG: peroxiredoxin-like family protein [Xanthomonadaceae bacterium]|nr:peroxiredoxin-like family protein [Xanthomonadaceae bacterium]